MLGNTAAAVGKSFTKPHRALDEKIVAYRTHLKQLEKMRATTHGVQRKKLQGRVRAARRGLKRHKLSMKAITILANMHLGGYSNPERLQFSQPKTILPHAFNNGDVTAASQSLYTWWQQFFSDDITECDVLLTKQYSV
eukprot:3043163-Karenia_brevis.AAC.1